MTQTPKASPPPAAAEAGAAKAHPYTRFIPREELGGFAAWAIGDLGTGDRRSHRDRRASPSAAGARDAAASGTAPIFRNVGAAREASPAAADPAELVAQQLRAARQGGYQDGYRDGLVALEGFKQSFAAQTTAQVGVWIASFGRELDALQQQMAAGVAAAATELARRVVRSELVAQPERIAAVAEEAIDALLLSARHIAIRVHPDDAKLVAAGAGEAITARGARIVADPAIARGGCRIESDIGGVDARIEERWRQATAAIGGDAPWQRDAPAAQAAPVIDGVPLIPIDAADRRDA